MIIAELQQFLVDRGAPIAIDSKFGPQTRGAILASFSNFNAPAVTAGEIAEIAQRLGCTKKQVRAVAKVESGGSAFDKNGRPKILFERHYFHRLTEGRWSVTPFSNPKGGGYSEDSWQKLADACRYDPWAAFQSASWGRFQVMGSHWKTLEYLSPLSMAWQMRQDEYAHYDCLARYIEKFGLADEMRALSTNPDSCRGFARGYNGPAYENFAYHVKLAEAMR